MPDTVTAGDLQTLSRMIKYATRHHGPDSRVTLDYVAQYERLSARLAAQAEAATNKGMHQ